MESVGERFGRPLPDLIVETACSGDTFIAKCRGRILYGVTGRYFRVRVAGLILRHPRVWLDLSEITHLDACGVGTLAGLVSLARRSHGRLVLAAPAGRVRFLLRLTRLDTHVDVVTPEELHARSKPASNASEAVCDSTARIA